MQKHYAKLSLTYANHVYVTNKMLFDLNIKYPSYFFILQINSALGDLKKLTGQLIFYRPLGVSLDPVTKSLVDRFVLQCTLILDLKMLLVKIKSNVICHMLNTTGRPYSEMLT